LQKNKKKKYVNYLKFNFYGGVNFMSNLPELNELLSYHNKHIIERYSKDYNTSIEDAEDKFTEMLKFIWISVKNGQEKNNDVTKNAHIAMYPEMTNIDNMWHTFILFTTDYFEFSQKYFGHYIHHAPRKSDEPIPSKEEFEENFTKFLSYTYDYLGEETVKKWFAQYCNE